MRVLTVVGRCLAALFGLSLLCIVLLAAFFNPNAYRRELQDWVSAQTGLSFTLDGDIGWHPGPQLELTLPAMRLEANPESNTTPQTFAAWQQARLSVSLWSLLTGKLVFGEFELHGLQLNLQRHATGGNNWEALLHRLMQDDQPGRFRFSRLDRMQIQDAELRLDDQRNQRRSTLQIQRLETSNVQVAHPIDVSMQLRITTHAGLQSLDMPLVLTTQLEAAPAQQQLRLRNLRSSGQLSSAGVISELVTHALPWTLALDQMQWQGAAGTLSVESLHASLGGAQLTGGLTLEQLNTTRPQLAATAQMTVPQLREWLQTLNLPVAATRDPGVLHMLRMEVQASGDAQALLLKVPDLQLDQTRMSGLATLTFTDPSRYGVTLHADQLNLDRYLPRLMSGGAAAASPVPLDWLRSWHLQGTLRIDQARLQGIEARQLILNLDTE